MVDGPRNRLWSELVDEAEEWLRLTQSILLTGPSGVGKTTLARAIAAERAPGGAFVVVNCGALTADLVESKLCGYERGAFTGAHTSRRGLLEQAHEGVIFFDELANLSPVGQLILLTAIEGSFIKVGGHIQVDVELDIIAATNEDLWSKVEAGTFREDLYHRIARHIVKLPPLEERPDAVVAIARSLINKRIKQRRLAKGSRLTPNAEAALIALDFGRAQGREVENIVTRACKAALAEGLTFKDPLILDAQHITTNIPKGVDPPGPRPLTDIEKGILDTLRAAPEGLRRGELADAVGVGVETMRGNCDRLANWGLVRNIKRRWHFIAPPARRQGRSHLSVEEKIINALRDAGTRGLKRGELITETGFAEGTVRNWLARLSRDGVVENISRRWFLACRR